MTDDAKHHDQQDVAVLLLEQAETIGDHPPSGLRFAANEMYTVDWTIFGFDPYELKSATRSLIHALGYAAKHGPRQHRLWVRKVIEQATEAAQLARDEFDADLLNRDSSDYTLCAEYRITLERIRVLQAIRVAWSQGVSNQTKLNYRTVVTWGLKIGVLVLFCYLATRGLA